MALLDWKKEYSVEVQQIDKEHQNLFGMLNELHDAMKSGKGSQVAPEVLRRLVAYTREHFAYEESLMIRAKYPDFDKHKAEHDRLTGEVTKTVQDFEAGKVMLSMKLLDFLKGWLQNHILTVDKKYTSYMQSAGIR
jgi:hemerythrin